ncbi:uncharacterized protein LOC115955855 isoform X3 [Quercus lobata]|nr:uncharacterized protein LOC115955855 isoform X3 [Quercus lobata]XP_030930090.1 uncharacterized protein LOC115955855 isoform X3 [Quercus lobata]
MILWNPVTMDEITLPCLPEGLDIKDCILTSPPSEPSCKVILFFHYMSNILYCELGDEEWTELYYYDELKRTIKEVGLAEESMLPMRHLLISPVCCDGDLYALWTPGGSDHDCCRKLVKIHEIHRDGLKIEPLNIFLRSALPITKEVHLMESCGDLFTVEIQYKDESLTGVLAIGIHRLNFSNKEWVQVETAKDRAFFLPLDRLDQQAFSIPVIDPDVANRVYFTLNGDDTYKKLYSYNIEGGTISISSTFLNLPRLQRSCPVWIMPHLRLTNTLKEDEHKSYTEEQESGKVYGTENDLKDIESTNDISILHFDMVKVIAERLILVDYLHFRATCKIFHSAASPIQWRIAMEKVENPSLLSPWLVFFENESVCAFIDPKHGDKYIINLPQVLKGGIICGSKDGWLLVVVAEKSHFFLGEKLTFFFNPFTQAILPLAENMDRALDFSCIGFSSSPPSSECVVVNLSKHESDAKFVVEYSSSLGQDLDEDLDHWHENEFNDADFSFNNNSPVFYKGAFYCLGKKGNLGILKLNDDGENTWEVLTKPKSPCMSGYDQNYLVECDGELFSVFVGNMRKWVQVFKLNESKMTWIRVENLGNHMFYLSCSSSFSVRAKTPGMENKIYFPIFCGQSMVFFSLETKKFHSFEGKDVDFYSSREKLRCGWIEPRWC